MRTLLLLLLAGLFILPGQAQVSEEEFQALKAIYNSTGGTKWKIKTGWENINTTATKDDVTSEWKGLNVMDGHLVELKLSDNNLVGYVPPQIGALVWLYNLDLSNNNLEGVFPSEIGALINLEQINFSRTLIQGPFPESFGNLIKLRNIYMNYVPLNCPFPNDVLIKLKSLVYFDAQSCGFTGQVGDIFDSIPRVESFAVNQNKLTGELPMSLNRLKLNSLHINDNSFTGSLPALDSSVSKMYYLTVNNNQFTGPIPEVYGQFIKLKYFHINDNNLHGAIPPGIFTPVLNRIYLTNNYFTFTFLEPVADELQSINHEIKTKKSFPLTMTETSFNQGSPLYLNAASLSVYGMAANNNRYKWFLNDQEVYLGNDPAYSVASAQPEHSGIYRFEVTNTLLTDVVLKSDPLIVSVLVPGNHAPTAIELSSNESYENAQGTIGTLSATDEDEGDDPIFLLIKGNGENDKHNHKFKIEGKNLKISSAANFESDPFLNVFVLANDLKGGIVSRALTIQVKDVDEAPDFINQVVSATIDETAPNGYTVLYLQAVDPEGAPVTYTITSGNANGAFGIDGDKLVVADWIQLDYDTQNQYLMKIKASDGTLSREIDIKVTLSKINGMPLVENAEYSLPENSPKDLMVGSVQATDPEGGLLSFTLISGNQDNAFRLDGNELFIENPAAIDYDRYPSFSLIVNVSDGISQVPAQITINLQNAIDETGNDILSFSFTGMKGIPAIDPVNQTVTANISGEDIAQVSPVFTVSKGAVSNPASGTMMDFNSPQTIVVSSETGVSKNWTVTVSYPLGMFDEMNRDYFLYPNPAADRLFVSGLKGPAHYLVSDLDGKVVDRGVFVQADESISIHLLPEGIYLLVLMENGRIQTFPFVRN